jgi:MFS family permease
MSGHFGSMRGGSTGGDWRGSIRLLWGGHFLSTASLTAIAPFLPVYMAGKGGDGLLLGGLALAAPAFTYAVAAPLWGRLGDRIGRKWMIVRALFGIAAVLIGMGFAQTPMHLLLLRLLQGVFGGVVDAGTAFAGSIVPEEERGKALGRLEAAVAGGSFAGPLVIGLFWGLVGFQTVLLLFGILLLLWGAAAAVFLKGDGQPSPADDKRTQLAAGNEAGMLQLVRELLSVRRSTVFIAAGICANIGAYGLMTVFAPYVAFVAGGSDQAAIWVGVLHSITWAAAWAASSWWGKRNDHAPVERNFACAALICCLAVMLQAAVSSPELLIVLRLLQGLGFSALLQSVFLVVMRSSNPRHRGANVGLTSSILVMGQMIGPVAGGLLAGWFSLPVVIVQFGALFGLSAVLMMPAAGSRRAVPWRMKGASR